MMYEFLYTHTACGKKVFHRFRYTPIGKSDEFSTISYSFPQGCGKLIPWGIFAIRCVLGYVNRYEQLLTLTVCPHFVYFGTPHIFYYKNSPGIHNSYTLGGFNIIIFCIV